MAQQQLEQLGARENRNYLQLVANNVVLHLHPRRVSAASLRFTYTWGLGGIATTLVVILAVTGILLMFRYEPTIDRAYTSIQTLETEIRFGSMVRAMHHWSANLLVVVAFLHLARVFFTGGFKKGRTANWIIGLVLMVLVVTFNFTGYLLPWDQLAYWAITVSTSLLQYIPEAGTAASNFLLAGPEVGQAALSNFYAIHVAVLPMLLILTMGYHFWKVRKNGGLTQPPLKAGQPNPSLTTIPHLIRREFAVAMVVLVGVMIWAMLVPAPLEALANPSHSPNPAKAAWYFLGLQELLLHMHALAAIGLTTIVLAGMVVLPYWDKNSDNIGLYFRSAVGKRAALVGALLAVYLVPVLVVVDEFWLDLPTLFPAWPAVVANGLLPLLLTLLGLCLIYFGLRWILKANHSEGLVGLYIFLMVSLVVMTVIGIFFRGPNMALVLPF